MVSVTFDILHVNEGWDANQRFYPNVIIRFPIPPLQAELVFFR